MRTNLNVMVVGAGGNGSWLLNRIHWLVRKNQLPETIRFTVYDGDSVENKNLAYQDFDRSEVLDNKAKALAIKYDVIGQAQFVKNEKDMEPFDVVICCVDNREFRELMFRYMEKHPQKYWIDVRAEGQNVLIYTKAKQNTLDAMLKTLPKESEGTSCQRQYELDNGIVQLGNQIAAIIAAQFLLNYIREEDNSPVFNHMF